MDCLKNKREAERDYKEKKEKGGIFNMTCDKVDAKVEVQADGSWKILEILEDTNRHTREKSLRII